ncbi:unnamed protein product, partial [Musa banksii]
MGSPLHSLFLAFFFAFFASHRASRSLVLAQKSPASVDVGVVLDLGTETGKRSRTSVSMAIDDFYALHGDHATRVVLHVRDSDKDAVGAAAAGTVSTTKQSRSSRSFLWRSRKLVSPS